MRDEQIFAGVLWLYIVMRPQRYATEDHQAHKEAELIELKRKSVGKRLRAFLRLSCIGLLIGCAKQPVASELARYPIDGVDGLLTRTGVTYDRDICTDQTGSLRIEATGPTTVQLYETLDLDVEDARLVYQGQLRCRELEGQAYLELLCHFPDKGDYFSRALDVALSGTTAWTSQQTALDLKPGENPDNIKLNLVVKGSGVVWIDDLRVLKEPR